MKGMTLPALVCSQMGYIPLNMTPSGNRPFPSKKWGRGQISRDTCSTGNHLLEESKSHKTVSASGISCWIQRGEGGGWLNAFLVVPFLFHTHSTPTHVYTLTMRKYTVAISPNPSQLCASLTFEEVLDVVGLSASADRAD